MASTEACTCPTPDGDSALSTTANIVSILTFAYILIAGSLYQLASYQSNHGVLSELLQETKMLREKLAPLRLFCENATRKEISPILRDWVEISDTEIVRTEKELTSIVEKGLQLTRNKLALISHQVKSSVYLHRIKARIREVPIVCSVTEWEITTLRLMSVMKDNWKMPKVNDPKVNDPELSHPKSLVKAKSLDLRNEGQNEYYRRTWTWADPHDSHLNGEQHRARMTWLPPRRQTSSQAIRETASVSDNAPDPTPAYVLDEVVVRNSTGWQQSRSSV